MQNWQYKSSKDAERAAIDTPALPRHDKEAENQGGNLDFAQINLVVSDLDKMRAFYEVALNLKEEPLPFPHHDDGKACRFPLPTGYFVLTRRAEDTADNPAAHSAEQIVFSAGSEEGVEAVFQRLRQIPDCKILQLPHYASDNRYELIIEDPEGNNLIFRD